MNIGQILMLMLFISCLCINAHSHGKEKTEKDSFWTALIAVTLQSWILYLGGFWKGLV